MHLNSTVKKSISITLLICFVNNILAPGMAFALTSGPENPNVTSFEPIDTTDMVNLFNGDLAYNIPLLEVPGPEGGYPLSLSYHAGIMPDSEASWVGLGWSLNPGAINRTVNGFPDDFNGQENIVRDYWKGREKTTTSVGVNIGIIGALSAEVGLTVAHDTFLGTGIGGYIGLSAGLNLGSGIQASSSIGLAIDPFGGTTVNGGLGIGVSIAKSGNYGIGGGVGIGFAANSSGASVGAGASISASATKGNQQMSSSLLGASISSGSGGMTFSGIGGYSGVANVNAGRIQSKSGGWGITVPVWFGVAISLKRNYVRYWSDETAAIPTYGSLNYPEAAQYSIAEFDTYYLPDKNDPNYDLLGKNDPMKTNGGAFPDFDNYSVLGQGIGGTIRPYAYQLSILGKGRSGQYTMTNRSEYVTWTEWVEVWDSYEQRFMWEEITVSSINSKNPTRLNFKFTNDFSNSYTQENTDIKDGVMNFDLKPKYGDNDDDYGYDASAERLASSRNVEYFSNDEIKKGVARLKGFIDNRANGFYRNSNPNQTTISGEDKRIGGFMITNESGVTYHYSLPVYAYDEMSRTESIYGIDTYNTQTRKNPYATSWLLTAVTGPDFVDINGNGLADKGDWGYWVSFEYGRWSSNYAWRNPGTGYKTEVDSRFRYYSKGKKELYYLDAIITPSHTAIFEKEIRADSKGLGNDKEYIPYDGLPTSELRLNNILLYRNDDPNLDLGLVNIRSKSKKYTKSPVHQGENVIDKYDIQELPSLSGGVLKKINFQFDYSLSPKVPNSFDDQGLIYESSNVETTQFARLGKLTLKQLSFIGVNGVRSIPAMDFEYDIPENLVRTSNNVVFSGKKANSNIYKFYISNVVKDSKEDFKVADIIKFNVNGTLFYALIKQIEEIPLGSNAFTKNMEVKFLGLDAPISTGSERYSWSTTKNPPYLSDYYDIWGLFKADYQAIPYNDNLARLPSKASAQSSDVWSLRRIHHALGMTTDIEYESDTYSNVALYRNAAIQIQSVENKGNSMFRINSVADFGIDLRDFIRSGDKVQLSLAGDYVAYTEGERGDIEVVSNISLSSGALPNLLVTEVGENYVLINDPNFYNELFVRYSQSNIYGGNMSAGGIGNNLGGGLRVKRIVNDEPITGVKMSVNYNYNRPDQTQLSSGTTSYEPLGIDLNVRIGDYEPYQKVLLKSFSKLLGLVRDVPGPGVMYEFVSVNSERSEGRQSVKQYGKTQYQFEVFNEGMVAITKEQQIATNSTEHSKIMLQNFTSRIGNLKGIVKYDVDGNKLSESINHYLHDEQAGNSAKSNKEQYSSLMSRFNNQGVIMERTAESRYNDKSRKVMTMRVNYPTVATGTTSIDYKTGIKTSSQILAYDFYSGQPIKTLTIDGFGNRFVVERRPAYRIYPEMGLKFKNPKNAHMLSQVAEEIVYKVDENNVPISVISANAITWSNQLIMLNDKEQSVNSNSAHSSAPNIWRQQKSYQWLPQVREAGTTDINDFKSFFNNGVNLPGWSLLSENILYSKYSNLLEVKDMNGNYTAVKMGYNQSKVVVVASPSNYSEMNYTGMEDGEISSGILLRGFSLGTAKVVSDISHTGNKSAKISSGQDGISYLVNSSNLTPGRNYSVSVWMKTDGDPLKSNLYYKVNGGTKVFGVVNTKKKAGDWYQVNLQILGTTIPANSTLEIGCTNTGSGDSYFDDLRFKPVNASMISYVYNSQTENLDYVLDNNNIFTKFQYDSQGRVIKTFRETFGYGVRQVSENVYNYANSLNPVWQSTGQTRCQLVNSTYNGLKEAEQKDVNAFSPTFNQVIWIVVGSSSECGANPSNCSGYDKKYINGVCETGRKEFVRSEPNRPTPGFRCYYVYYFSDGSKGQEFIEFNPVQCTVW